MTGHGACLTTALDVLPSSLRAEPLQAARADHDRGHVPLAGHVDDRIRHVDLVGDRQALGLKSHRPSQLGALLRRAAGAFVELLLDLAGALDVDRDRRHLEAGRGHRLSYASAGSQTVTTSTCREPSSAGRLPNRVARRVRAVVGDQNGRVGGGHARRSLAKGSTRARVRRGNRIEPALRVLKLM